jgi:hypothetical protein
MFLPANQRANGLFERSLDMNDAESVAASGDERLPQATKERVFAGRDFSVRHTFRSLPSHPESHRFGNFAFAFRKPNARKWDRPFANLAQLIGLEATVRRWI